MNRRQFLKQTAAATASLTTVAGSVAGVLDREAAVIPIVDTHQHLWDLTRFRLPWIKPGESLDRSFLPEDYHKATAGLHVVKAVYMEVDVDPKQQQAEADYIIDVCKSGKGPTVAAVISGRPASDGFKGYITAFKDNPYIKGVRQVLHGDSTPAGYCLEEKFIKGIQLLGELGMSYDLCLRPGELLDGAKLIDACPDTRFILDHCGNANVQAKDQTQWKRDMEALAKRKKVVGKVSGIVASAKPGAWTAEDLAPFVNHTLEVFGPERVMFGGDWPVCTLAATYKQWVEALKSIVRGRSEQDQKKLFHDNAVKFYGLG
jgi:predicted TIM-barrel fold metal-dependent hydrolase